MLYRAVGNFALAFASIEEDKRFRERFLKCSPEERAALIKSREDEKKEEESHRKKLEIARAGRAVIKNYYRCSYET